MSWRHKVCEAARWFRMCYHVWHKDGGAQAGHGVCVTGFNSPPPRHCDSLHPSAVLFVPFGLRVHATSLVCSTSAEYLCLSYSLPTVYGICATMALKLQSALGTQKGGPITAQATEAGSLLIGSCVSGAQRRCQSQHFASLFPRSLSFLSFPISLRLPTTDAAGLTCLQDTCLS